MSDDRSDSFAALFEQSPAKKARTLRVGERLEGTVILVGRDAVFVEVDGKREAFIEANELRAPDGTLSVKVGDVIAAQVVAVDEGGQVRLARSLTASGDAASLERARQAGVAVEGKITGVNKGGLEVDVAGHRAFCPLSQVERRGGGLGRDPDGASALGAARSAHEALIGQKLTFMVTEVRDNGRNIVVSRRAVLEQEAGEVAKRTIESLVVGAVVKGTITAVRDFGAFVDLGGIEGLIPASEVAHDRSRAIGDAVHAGDVVEVLVREIKDPPKPGATPKITLSLKALAPAPEGVAAPKPATPDAQPTIGSVVTGKVAKIETYGVFVQLDATGGRAGRGLVPSAELGVPRGTDLRKAFPEGAPVVVKVLETGDRKLRLSIKAAKDHEERAQFEDAKSKMNVPQTLGTFGDLLSKSGKAGKRGK